MRVPRSGLANSLIKGARITAGYPSGGMFLPNWSTSGKITAADAPPNSRAETRDGSIRYDANSGGKDAAESFKVLTLGQS